MTFQYLEKEIKTLLTEALFDARKAHKLIFKETDSHNRNLQSALAYINNMVSKSCAAQAIYVSNVNILEDPDIESLFFSFKVYADEYIKSYSTDHSFQWVDIEYGRLTERFQNSPMALEHPFD